MSKPIKKQVLGIIEEQAARLEGLKGRGRKVADEVAARGRDVAEQVKARVTHETAKGHEVLGRLLADVTPKDLLDRFGTMKVADLVEKVKASDLARHSGTLRADLLAALRVPTTETVERMQGTIDRLAKEVAALKGLKGEIARLADQVRVAVRKPEPKPAPAPEPKPEPAPAPKAAPKAPAKPKAAPKAAPKVAKKA